MMAVELFTEVLYMHCPNVFNSAKYFYCYFKVKKSEVVRLNDMPKATSCMLTSAHTLPSCQKNTLVVLKRYGALRSPSRKGLVNPRPNQAALVVDCLVLSKETNC
jgi:hypothetical protein